jgi:hypothetical protein
MFNALGRYSDFLNAIKHYKISVKGERKVF